MRLAYATAPYRTPLWPRRTHHSTEQHGILYKCFGDRRLHPAITLDEEFAILESGVGTAINIQNPNYTSSYEERLSSSPVRQLLLVVGLRKKHWSAAVRSLAEAVRPSGRIKLCEVDVVPLVFLSKGGNKSEAVALGRGIVQVGYRMPGKDDIRLENAGADAWKAATASESLSAEDRTEEDFEKWKQPIADALVALRRDPNFAIVIGI